jgi:hypothetical protein
LSQGFSSVQPIGFRSRLIPPFPNTRYALGLRSSSCDSHHSRSTALGSAADLHNATVINIRGRSYRMRNYLADQRDGRGDGG